MKEYSNAYTNLPIMLIHSLKLVKWESFYTAHLAVKFVTRYIDIQRTLHVVAHVIFDGLHLAGDLV